jgi:hypothetical protein
MDWLKRFNKRIEEDDELRGLAVSAEIEEMFGVYAHDGENPMTETHSDLKSAQAFFWGDDSCGESEEKNPQRKDDTLILRPVSWRYLVPRTGSRPKEKCKRKAA